MESFRGRLGYVDDNATLNSYCNNANLNSTDFARYVKMIIVIFYLFYMFRSQYCRNNFNDYLSSLIVLFELTVVNQWHGKTTLSFLI
jgi:hypothetical protein